MSADSETQAVSGRRGWLLLCVMCVPQHKTDNGTCTRASTRCRTPFALRLGASSAKLPLALTICTTNCQRPFLHGREAISNQAPCACGTTTTTRNLKEARFLPFKTGNNQTGLVCLNFRTNLQLQKYNVVVETEN